MIDTYFAGDILGAVPEEKETRAASRYETFIATFIALLAVSVAGYTAYMQRQQVRAAVWPILEFDSSNGPDIHFTVANKGVGPADHTACHCKRGWPPSAELEWSAG
jgi:hypothetical protein